MKVVDMKKYRARKTTDVLRQLLVMAEACELNGVIVCAMDSLGQEHTAITGCYESDPTQGVRSALRMSLTLNELDTKVVAL